MRNLSYYIAYLDLYKAEIIKVILYVLVGYAFFYDCLRDTRSEYIAYLKEQTFDFKVVSFKSSREYQVEGVDRDGRTRVKEIQLLRSSNPILSVASHCRLVMEMRFGRIEKLYIQTRRNDE